MSDQHGIFGGLAEDECTQEATGKGVTRAVGVDDLVVRQTVNLEDLGLVRLVAEHEDGVVGTLGKDNNTRSGSISLRQESDGAGDSWQVFGIGVAGGQSPCLSFGLVTDDNIGIREDLLELVGEELGNEGRGKVEDEGLEVEIMVSRR